MIRFDDVSVTYEGSSSPSLSHADFTLPEGELTLLVGPSGAGKSTLLGAVSGLVPHFTGGRLQGRVTVAGRNTRTHKPRELADVVGTVGQDPLAHFVTDVVEDELAYGMESLGLAPSVMRRRVEETLDLLGLGELRDRPLATLSGGQQQRVAIGSVLTPHPRVLVLDEPTSALDPAAAEEVLAVLQRLVHDLGTTVLMAEHRLERVVQYADQVLLLPSPGAPPVLGSPSSIMAVSPVHPPVVALGRLAGWSPLPLSIRDARRQSAPLRSRLSLPHTPPPAPTPHAGSGAEPHAGAGAQPRGTVGGRVGDGRPQGPTTGTDTDTGPGPGTDTGLPTRTHPLARLLRRRRPTPTPPPAPARHPVEPPAQVSGVSLRRGRAEVLRGIALAVAQGEIVALMGRNGAGKSTLLATLVGTLEPTTGQVTVSGRTPHRTPPPEMVTRVGLVPQEPRDLLYADTVAAECAAADADAGQPPGTCRALVTSLLPDVPDDTHPRDLSEGQRLALALALVLTGRPALLLLDEPTRGLDYAAKARLVEILRGLVADGHAIVLATHDVELAAELAHRVVILAGGEIVADGPTAEVVVSSPAFAPQVAKVLAPAPWLTVSQVSEALDRLAQTEALAGAQRETDPHAPPTPHPAAHPAADPTAHPTPRPGTQATP
ncbi:ATP-binding cassette domain-containing protein [Streptomyces sp. NPDC006544]|uniref:ABC transporter ATP-binding protein n=1 Tax=Streptomyces sp. NPDC006544 TaxID=3154583 RepID=UPI00339ED856